MKDNEVKLWTVAVGNAPGPLALTSTRARAKKAIKIIKQQEGLVGVHPEPPYGTLLLFKTENEAKKARNVLLAATIECGKNIGNVFVKKSDLPNWRDDNA